jgi:uncharacterized protein YjiS (DUF1127 family)
MIECIDTIRAPGPLETLAARLSAGMLRGARALDRAAVRSLDLVFEWRSRASERHVLRSLDDRMLRDVGLSRADIERELRKPFWNW